MDRYTVKISLDITKNASEDSPAAPFFQSSNEWSNMDYEGTVVVEDIMVGALDKLVDMGYAESVKKGGNPEEAKQARAIARGRQ